MASSNTKIAAQIEHYATPTLLKEGGWYIKMRSGALYTLRIAEDSNMNYYPVWAFCGIYGATEREA